MESLNYHAQETSRAGRDGELALAIFSEGVGEENANAKVNAYILGKQYNL